MRPMAEYIPCDVGAGSGKSLHSPVKCEKRDTQR